MDLWPKTCLGLETNIAIVVVAAVTWVFLTVSAQGQSYREILLHSFNSGTDGSNPMAPLVLDAAGNLYGTTNGGGTIGGGTIFRVDPTGNESVLYSFSSGVDGRNPTAGLILVGSELYGTTEAGGASGYGTVFQVSTSGQETVLYSFQGGTSGAYPSGGLIRDSAGNSDYLSDGITEGVIDRLSGLPNLKVISRTSTAWRRRVDLKQLHNRTATGTRFEEQRLTDVR